MNRILFLSLFILSLVMFSCKKELSLENSKKQGASGSLQAEATGECLPKAVGGVYIPGTSLDNTNFIEVDVDVDTEGSYTISTDTINGYYFAGSGEFTSTGMNTVKLLGKGKPLADGVDIFTVGFDSTYCIIDVAVTTTPPPPTSTFFWKFTSGGVTYQGSVDSANAELTTETVNGMTIAAFSFYGETVTGDTAMELILGDFSGAINANETYSSSATSSNLLSFSLDDTGGVYYADPSTTGVSLSAKVTSHNTTTKVIEGTFSGTAKEGTTGATKTITNGQFKVNY